MRNLERITGDQDAWDATVLANNGHMLQSWRWGELKGQFGWQVERVAAHTDMGVAQAQVLFRQKAGVSIGYIPRGPALLASDATALARLWPAIDRVARQRRALTVVFEPDGPLPSDVIQHLRLEPGPPSIQPARTVKIELADDESLLKHMHQKTRYNVRLAQRRGVTTRVSELSDSSIASFYQLLQDTAARNEFGIHSFDYYRTFLGSFRDDAALIFADIDRRPVAGVVVVAFGPEAIYMYGASSTRERAHGAGFLIQFEAMRWARERGCTRYDLWGIPPHDPQSTKVDNGDRIAGTIGNDWRGLYEFKTRFGGAIVGYPEPLERRYRPILTAIARRLYDVGRGE